MKIGIVGTDRFSGQLIRLEAAEAGDEAELCDTLPPRGSYDLYFAAGEDADRLAARGETVIRLTVAAAEDEDGAEENSAAVSDVGAEKSSAADSGDSTDRKDTERGGDNAKRSPKAGAAEESLPCPHQTGAVRALLQRRRGEVLGIDEENRCAILRGERIRLTEVEYLLFRYLFRAGGRYVPRADILRAVWGDGTGTDGIVNVYVHYLREKLEKDGERRIFCSRKEGYALSRGTEEKGGTHEC